MHKNNSINEYLGFNDFWLCVIGVPIVAFITPIVFYGGTLAYGLVAFFPQFLIGIYYTLLYWLGSRYIIIRIRKKYPLFKDAKRRNIQQTSFVAIYATIVSIVSELCLGPIFDLCRVPVETKGMVAPYIIIFLMNAIYESIYFYYQLKLSIEEKEEVRRAQLHSELQGLRNQVNPHFLFNSLNTLMNIVAEDQKLAISFLKKLSKVYRYVLDNRREQLIPLSKEIEFIESYVFLQKERFQEKLLVEIDISNQYLDYKIIPLALQILFENAIKHNIISSDKPLRIRVGIENNKLFVSNNLQRKNIVMPGTKVGLENVKTRYKIFTEETVEVRTSEKEFSVAIPLIENLKVYESFNY